MLLDVIELPRRANNPGGALFGDRPTDRNRMVNPVDDRLVRNLADRCSLSRGQKLSALQSVERITDLVQTAHAVGADKGRCSALASSQGARSQISRSSLVVKITGIAFGWIGSTTAFGEVVRKPYT